MKRYILTFLAVAAGLTVKAQPNIMPAKPQSKPMVITGATIHTGAGQVIPNGYISFENGKITGVGDMTTVRINTSTHQVIDGTGKHVYPGFISPVTNVGLVEYSSVRASVDNAEVGSVNPHVRALIAYNTDSKVPNTLRTNGILLAQVTPSGGLISGQSSVVEMDGWNWEDAALKADLAMHMNWPNTTPSPFAPNPEAAKAQAEKMLNDMAIYFSEAAAYAALPKSEVTNARFGAMKGLFNGSKKLFISANGQKDILAAVNFAKRYGITPVIVGGRDAHLVSDFLKSNNVSVILGQPHALPQRSGDDVYLPYKQAKLLQDAGVNYAISVGGYWQQRNLPFMAGTAAAYGLTKEQALSAITLNTARILGIDKRVGSLEVGKDATFFISGGDALDMIGNDVQRAFIRGKDLDLDNLHKQLFKRYSEKYGE